MTAPAPSQGFNLRRFLLSGTGWPYLLVPFIPIAIALELAHASASLIFVTSALGVIPTAALMGRATEELAARSGPGIGGFLNVTFGNAPELIIAFFALNEGLQEVVKASLIGSILGNVLLVMGAAMFIGGRKRDRQFFDRTAANVTALMLLLAVVAMIMPALFELVQGDGPAAARRSRRTTTPPTSSTCRSAWRSCCCSPTPRGCSSRCARTRTCSTPSTPPRTTWASRGPSGAACSCSPAPASRSA